MNNDVSKFNNMFKEQQSGDTGTQEGDEALFKKLDECSGDLRIAAEDMADFLRTLKNSSPELLELESCFRKIKTVPINKIDLCLNNIERQFLKIQLKQLDGKEPMAVFIKDETKLESYVTKQVKFNDEGALLLQKAFELSQTK